jgi:type IV secretory pathway TraG/TraD family ATPase VirD4
VLVGSIPTIFIPTLMKIPATGRSNKMALVYMAQHFSQMDAMYGKDKRSALVTNLATQFYGNVSGMETAKYVSD